MKSIIIFYFLISPFLCFSQTNRLRDNNTIVWPQVFSTIKLNNKFDWLAEYQWRRTDGLKNWQQSLLRTALQYKINNDLSIAVGYGWIETFKYGDYPVTTGSSFPEHRMHQQIQLKKSFDKLVLSQRFRIEQRWIARIKGGTENEVEDWVYSNRFRHLIKVQHPVIKNILYASVADEVFINAGKNIDANTFDQNRIMLALGSRLSDNISIETGFINQTLFQGKIIDGKTIVQNNNGLTVAMLLSF